MCVLGNQLGSKTLVNMILNLVGQGCLYFFIERNTLPFHPVLILGTGEVPRHPD